MLERSKIIFPGQFSKKNDFKQKYVNFWRVIARFVRHLQKNFVEPFLQEIQLPAFFVSNIFSQNQYSPSYGQQTEKISDTDCLSKIAKNHTTLSLGTVKYNDNRYLVIFWGERGGGSTIRALPIKPRNLFLRPYDASTMTRRLIERARFFLQYFRLTFFPYCYRAYST